jgi:H+/Cl- antiporter ClcA
MGRDLVVVFFGLFPIWAALALIYLGAHDGYVSSDYGSTAPWLLVFAIPCCFVTLPVVLFGLRFVKKSEDKPGRYRNGRKW